MNKIKSPLVKVLRKAGYSVKEAMSITYEAKYEYNRQRSCGSTNFNALAQIGRLTGMFDFSETIGGLAYWFNIQDKIDFS